MTKKTNQETLREMKEALKGFPKEVRRQERAHRHDMKIEKAFGKLCLVPTKSKPLK